MTVIDPPRAAGMARSGRHTYRPDAEPAGIRLGHLEEESWRSYGTYSVRPSPSRARRGLAEQRGKRYESKAMLRLYTFVISHFSEKVRWALDFEGLGYTERRLIPGPHMLTIRRRAPNTTVPVLEHDGANIQGSSTILDYLQQRLGARKLAAPPGTEAKSAELEELADHAFGLGIQRIFYAGLLDERATVVDLWSQKGPKWSRAFYALGYPVVAGAVRRMYTIKPEAVTRAKDRFRDAMDRTDALLKNKPYLLGDAPSRADITVSSLLAPLCMPPEHLVKWPVPPHSLKGFVSEFEGRPTYDYVLAMYRKHRAPVLAGQA